MNMTRATTLVLGVLLVNWLHLTAQDLTTQGLQDLTTQGLQDLTSQGLQDLTTQGLQDLTTQGLQDLTTQGLQDLTTQGLQDLATHGLQDLTTQGLQDLTTQGLQDLTTHRIQYSAMEATAIPSLGYNISRGSGGPAFISPSPANDDTDAEESPLTCGRFQCLSMPCHNGGTCSYDPTIECNKCSCPDDSRTYDALCRIRAANSSHAPSPSTSTVSTRTEPSSVSACVIPLQCLHGHCQNLSPRSARCACNPGWTGRYCSVSCSLNCSNNGTCDVVTINGTDSEVCVCPHPWVGSRCSRLPPQQKVIVDHSAEIGGACGAIVVVVLGMVAGFMYFLWTRRLVFVLRIVYSLKGYEDQDGKDFDAFVSCVESDHGFVYGTLLTKLENEFHFKLSLQERDWAIGSPKAEEALAHLERSRRFILVLSPEYLQCQWRRFEFQRAFMQMVERKVRIVLVVARDVSHVPGHVMDRSLRDVMRAVPLFTFPTPHLHPHPDTRRRREEKFWRQLRLSMPKKKPRDPEAGSAQCPADSLTLSMPKKKPRDPEAGSAQCPADSLTLSVPVKKATPPISITEIALDL